VQERWNLPNSVVWICHSFVMGRENEWFMRRKKNDCCDSFNEI